MTDQVGKIEQLTDPEADRLFKKLEETFEAFSQLGAIPNHVREMYMLAKLSMTQNTRIRELENEKIQLLDQLADAGMEIKRLREALLTIRHLAKALDYAGIKKLVDEHFGAIDQDEIEREVMK